MKCGEQWHLILLTTYPTPLPVPLLLSPHTIPASPLTYLLSSPHHPHLFLLFLPTILSSLWRSSSKLYELKTLNLCGCVRLTDTTMQRLGQALTTSPSHRHISLCWSDAEEEESSDECGAGTVCYWSTDYSESDIECCCLASRKVGLEGWNGI